MQKSLVTVLPAKEQNTKKFPYSLLELCLLLAGVFGLQLFLRDVDGVDYAIWPVFLLVSAFCIFWWFLGTHRTVVFWVGTIVIFAGCGLLVMMRYESIRAQLSYFIEILKGLPDPEIMNMNEMALLAAVVVTFLLFWLELVWKAHTLLLLLTMALLLLSPLFGITISVEALLFLSLYQFSFWAFHGLEERRRKNVSREETQSHVRRRAGYTVSVLAAFTFLIAVLVVTVWTDSLFDAVYEAEGFIQRSASSLSGRADEPVTGGQVSSGNNYRTGAAHLALTASAMPTETLYLRGFGGGEYIGGDWIRSSDEALFENMEELLSEQEFPMPASSYYSMYFVMNEAMTEEEPATPISLQISHVSGNYENAYVPYYSEREQNWANYWNQEDTSDSSSGGYTYDYYEQKDMQIDWEQVSESFIEQRDWYRMFQEAYMDQIQTAYTQVPTELLPRLTSLVEENPLEDLYEITAFVLYTLHSNAEYSLTPGWASMNEDIVEYFLFEGKRGYCEQFAATATLMYRLYGIPARYATGYAVSPSSFEEQEDGSYFAVATDEEAHAWVELFLPEYGWTPVEVTPAADGSSVASYPGFDSLELEQLLGEHQWNMKLPSLESHPSTEENEAEQNWSLGLLTDIELDIERYRDLLLVMASCLGYTVLLLPFFLDYRRLRLQKKMETMNCRRIFARLLKMLHSFGTLSDADGSEPDFAEKLVENVPGLSLDEIEAFLENVRKEAFGRPSRAVMDNRLALLVYRNTAKQLYLKQNIIGKLVFKYIKAF